MTFEALLGDSFQEELGYTDGMDWGDSQAFILNSEVDAGTGDVNVMADTSTQVNATLNNVAESMAEGIENQSGKAATGALANMGRGEAIAYIKDDKDNSFTGDATVTAGSITVEAKDNAELYSNVQFASNSVSVSDGGAGLLDEFIDKVAYANYTDKTTSVQLENGDRVRITDTDDDNYGNVMIFLGQDGINPTDGTAFSTDLTAVDFWRPGLLGAFLETQVVLGAQIFRPRIHWPSVPSLFVMI